MGQSSSAKEPPSSSPNEDTGKVSRKNAQWIWIGITLFVVVALALGLGLHFGLSKADPGGGNDSACVINGQDPCRGESCPETSPSSLCCSGFALSATDDNYICAAIPENSRQPVPRTTLGLSVTGSSVASGYNIFGLGCEGYDCYNCSSVLNRGPGCGSQDPVPVSAASAAKTSPLNPRYVANPVENAGCYLSWQSWYYAHTALSVNAVRNTSYPGDCTRSLITRLDDVLADGPDFVLLGLSLANEGSGTGLCTVTANIVDTFIAGMHTLVDTVVAGNAIPIIGSCYVSRPSLVTYAQTMEANRRLNTEFAYPVVDFLGALDNGDGQWQLGFEQTDDWLGSAAEGDATANHPTVYGQAEMYYAFVPTMLDVLKSPLNKHKPSWQGLGTQGMVGRFRLTIPLAETMHSWTTLMAVTMPTGGRASATISAKGTDWTPLAPLPAADGGPSLIGDNERMFEFPNLERHEYIMVRHSYPQASVESYVLRRANGGSYVAFAITQHSLVRMQVNELLFESTRKIANLCVWRGWKTLDAVVKTANEEFFEQGSMELYVPGVNQNNPYVNLAISNSVLTPLAVD